MRAAATSRTAGEGTPLRGFTDDICFSLHQQPRQLPSKYLYDPLGSSLFDAICQLPWYPIWRAELSLLSRHREEIAEAVGPVSRVIELGCGSGDKLAALVAALPARPLEVVLVDVSLPALLQTREKLGQLGDRIDVSLVHGTYEDGLERTRTAATSGPTLAAFFGSNIGNFDPPGACALLRQVRGALGNGDRLLVGADLVKPEAELLLAYDDPLGVTAAFNKNLLVRINRELGGNFAIDQFAHRAVWNRPRSRVEMHLLSRISQDVFISGAGLHISLAAGEGIWTESSYKYLADGVARLVEPAGFRQRQQWIESSAGFSTTLFEATPLA